MSHSEFYARKMRWLMGICTDPEVSHSTFRIVFMISDHLNVYSQDCYPSHGRIASLLSTTSKTVQRSVKQLELRQWVDIKRHKGRNGTHLYSMRWPDRAIREGLDKPVRKRGQLKPSRVDTSVQQTFSNNLNITFSNGQRGRTNVFSDRGEHEKKIIERFGPEMVDLLGKLHDLDPAALNELCEAQKNGTLTGLEITIAMQRVSSGNRTLHLTKDRRSI